ncbi:Condensin complex subunit 3 [Erysiphe neolycopersici]|uniref:Condensin complex subunit 3 n=1 Tax=Erysiphe neolycopersici TaxID=212602 RepID=A0A420HNV1_9PEZI|nr:Condensin complex subunit 3 [Erysiphe neolycopersici]
MPTRISKSRSQNFKSVSNKASIPALNSRVSTASKIPLQLLEESPGSGLRAQITAIFSDAQRNLVGHRKLVIKIRRIQEACCYEVENGKKDFYQAEGFDEEQFKNEFVRCILRILPVKKIESVGDRVIRFVGLFLRLAHENDSKIERQNIDSGKQVSGTPNSRLISYLMDIILPLLAAKDKSVRYRSTQLISHIINSLNTIDDDLFQRLQQGLQQRIYDKEAIVRAQAVLGLSRLAANDIDIDLNDCDSENDDEGSIQKLCGVLQNDPSADVRRFLLTNMPILPNTLPFLLERARDQDQNTRRALYSRLLPALGDFRHLSLSMREKLLRWGMRDRDDNVRKAAHKLFRERWINDCASSIESERNPETTADVEIKHPNFDALLELLERIDVVNSGIESGVALEAMKGFWSGRPDYTNEVSFDDNFWNTLTAESVFMARTLNDFCKSKDGSKYEAMIEEKMPEVMKLAFYLERYIQLLVDALNRSPRCESGADEDEEDTVEQEFIVEQLLHIANTLDYSDEVGRRKMFALLRQSLSIPDLPEEVTKLIVTALRGICARNTAGEREFCSVVLEAVADIHDTIIDDAANESNNASFHSAKSEITSKNVSDDINEIGEEEQKKAIREIMINIKCLHIVQCMLENVEGQLQKNTDLIAMLNNLVVPAVRSHEAPVRERGLLCLGLCSLLDKSLAEENLTLFMHFFTKGHPALQITALQILTDILVTYGAHLLDNNPLLLKVYLKALKSGNKNPEVQAVATIALAKLLLGRIISETSPAINDFLRVLVVLYFDPSSAQNQSVRQTLSYFLPVYAYSCKENQDRIRVASLDAFHKLFEARETINDEDEAEAGLEMVSMSTIGAHLVDWTDPRKCYINCNRDTSDETLKKKNVDGDVHLEFAKDIITRLSSSISREEKKLLASLLGKIHISPRSTATLLRETFTLASQAIDENLLNDATSRNALFKIHVSLGKIVNSMKDINSIGHLTVSVESRKSGESMVDEEGCSGKTILPSIEGRDSVEAETDEFDENMDNEKASIRNYHVSEESS